LLMQLSNFLVLCASIHKS